MPYISLTLLVLCAMCMSVFSPPALAAVPGIYTQKHEAIQPCIGVRSLEVLPDTAMSSVGATNASLTAIHFKPNNDGFAPALTLSRSEVRPATIALRMSRGLSTGYGDSDDGQALPKAART